MRNIEAGFRGFLVYDEGVLFILNKMREQGLIPKETIFKFSVFGGYCPAAGAKVAEKHGGQLFESAFRCIPPILSSIRKAVTFRWISTPLS